MRHSRFIGLQARQFEHPNTEYYVEFPPGPIAFGETVVSAENVATLATDFGPVRIVTPTQIIMDRLAAYTHWKDNQSFDQAIWSRGARPWTGPL